MLPGFDSKPLKRSTKRLVKRAGVVEPGSVEMWPLATPKEGYLSCDGTAYPINQYADLYAVIRTTFNTGGEPTGYFRVPNYVNRMPIGSGGLYAIAATGGSKDAIVVSHNHTATTSISDPGHNHPGVTVGTGAIGNVPAGGTTTVVTGNTGIPSNTTGVTASTTVNSSGASGTDANLPPYLALNFIIKT